MLFINVNTIVTNHNNYTDYNITNFNIYVSICKKIDFLVNINYSFIEKKQYIDYSHGNLCIINNNVPSCILDYDYNISTKGQCSTNSICTSGHAAIVNNYVVNYNVNVTYYIDRLCYLQNYDIHKIVTTKTYHEAINILNSEICDIYQCNSDNMFYQNIPANLTKISNYMKYHSDLNHYTLIVIIYGFAMIIIVIYACVNMAEHIDNLDEKNLITSLLFFSVLGFIGYVIYSIVVILSIHNKYWLINHVQHLNETNIFYL